MLAIDGGDVILFTTISGVVITITIAFIRLCIRMRRKPREFSSADVFIVAALAVYLLRSALVLWEVREGLGNSVTTLSDTTITNIQKAFYADNALFIMAVWLTKASTACLLFRLSDRSVFRIICGSCIFSMVFTMTITLAIVTLTCNLTAPWIRFRADSDVCTDMIYRWQAVTVLDLVTEAILGSISILMVFPIQISPSLKALIVLAFNQRLLIVVPIVLQLHFLSVTSSTMDPTLEATKTVICREVEVIFAIFAATVPCLPKFVTATETYDVHYAPSTSMTKEAELTIGQKAALMTKTSLANLRSLTPLFGNNYAAHDASRTIRLVPVHVYDLDNTAAMMDTRPPRDPPKIDTIDFGFTTPQDISYNQTQHAVDSTELADHSHAHPSHLRYVIGQPRTAVPSYNYNDPPRDFIAVAL